MAEEEIGKFTDRIKKRKVREMFEDFVGFDYQVMKKKVEAAQAEKEAALAEKEAMWEKLEEKEREIARLKERLAMAG